MVNIAVNKCPYCHKVANTFRLDDDVFNLFQHHKRYAREARFCQHCIDRAKAKICRTGAASFNASNREHVDHSDSTRSIASKVNSSEPIDEPGPSRNVAKRTKGPPREREGAPKRSTRGNPAGQNSSPRAPRPSKSPRPGPSHQRSQSPQFEPANNSDTTGSSGGSPALPDRSRQPTANSSLAPLPSNRPTRTGSLDSISFEEMRNMTPEDRNETMNSYKRPGGG